MAFVRLMCKAANLEKRQVILEEEKKYASSLPQDDLPKVSLKQRYRHRCDDIKRKFRRLCKGYCIIPKKTCLYRFLYKLKYDGSCENFVLKSIAGFIGGFLITYVFFMFFVFQLNFKFSTATIMCSIFGSILTIGLAFSYKVRCIVFLTLPQLFSKRGRQALLAYAFILAITGPAKNTLNNMGILSGSLACGQEQLKEAVSQILEVIKKPFRAIKDAIKEVVRVVKIVVKKIKEILLAIKRVMVAIIKVIKAVFLFLAKILNVCNKELGTPFQRCSRVFENAISDCRAKLGPSFSWLCSITYLVQTVCYTVKMFDFICALIDFIKTNIVGVVVKKIKNFIRHVKTMFYVRIKFSHVYFFETNASKSLEDVTTGIATEIKARTEGLVKVFDFMSGATSLFFMFIIFRVLYYRFKFLTEERFDNRFINKDFRAIDNRRAQLGKETVLPLNQRERNTYISVGSFRLVEKEKLKLSQSAVVLGMATLKLATHMMADYTLFWVLMKIRKHASFQSTFEGTKIPTLQVSGKGFFADLLRSIVKAFQPMGVRLEIDTVPCLPDPIPPDYDRYVQIASLLVICWILTVFEPYGLRWRHSVMCFYHPTRAKERAIWLYNKIIRTRSSFLKFARRQLRRKFRKDHSIAKVTCKEYLEANLTARFKILRLCITPKKQMACLLCGEIFREEDKLKPIKCQTPGCPGLYCEQCFQDLQNLCTICLDPIQYGDLSDVSEEKDSSGDEVPNPTESKTKKRRKCKLCKKICGKDKDDSGSEKDYDNKDKTIEIVKSKRETDSDYYSTDADSDAFEYQYRKDVTEKAAEPPKRTFVDLEKQHQPDYASMESFRGDEIEPQLSDTKATIGSEKLMEDVHKLSIEETETESRPVKKKPFFLKKLRLFKRKKKQVDEMPLLTKESSSDDENEVSYTTTTETTYIESTRKNKKTGMRKRIPMLKKLEPSSSSETTFIETPQEISPKRKLPLDFYSSSEEETPRKRARDSQMISASKETFSEPTVSDEVLPLDFYISPEEEAPRKRPRESQMIRASKQKFSEPPIPDEIPKLNLDFSSCRSPTCTRHPCTCKRVRYHLETETSRRYPSGSNLTLQSSSTHNETATSPTSETMTTTTSVFSSQTNVSSPHETINYLYDIENRSPFIDHNKSHLDSLKLQQSSKGKTVSRTAVSDEYVKKFKRKVHDYYKKTHYDNPDISKVNKVHQSIFAKLLNRLLRKDIFERPSTRPRLTKSFLSESDETSSASSLADQEHQKKTITTNVQIPEASKSQYQSHSLGTYFISAFYNIFMGGRASTKQDTDNEESPYSNIEERESDESFKIIADKFGYYDSTDSDLSELHFPTNYNKDYNKDKAGIRNLDKTSISNSQTELEAEKIRESERRRREKEEEEKRERSANIKHKSQVSHSKEEENRERSANIKRKSQVSHSKDITLREYTDSESQSNKQTSSESSHLDTLEDEISKCRISCKLFAGETQSSNEVKSSQMSIERKRSSLDRNNSTRYSREPPERDQNYEENLKSSCCQCRNSEDCKRHQDYNTSYQYNRRKNTQSEFCPDRRQRTTYDLAKSAENLRQDNVNRINSYSSQHKRGQQSYSSPEVSKNRLPIKQNEMNSNDNQEYMYNDYMSSRSVHKNDCYTPNQDHMKNRYPQKYPYEEPLQEDEYNNDNHDRNCVCEVCTRRISRRDHYRNCKCCECMRTKRPMEDQMSSYSEESQGLNLAYQKTEEYPVLVDEIENTISMRNKERVRRTMRQFELLSRQNKGLDKPIYDDDEEESASNRFSCNKRNPQFNRPPSNDANRYCYDRNRNYQTRSECLSDKPTYSATPFPRSRGYVEKVARYMDPSMSDNTQKYPKFQSEYNTNTKWQMDPRSGEWVKVYDNYDFDNNFPPLPPTPSPMYRDYDNYPKNQHFQNYYNPPSHRSSSPIKHSVNKPCSCRNCIGGQSNSRY